MQYKINLLTQAGFQIDALSSASDWLNFKKRRFDWLRVSPRKHQFENPSQTINELEKLPVDELQKENEILKSENADLEEQVKFINENYERHQDEKLKIENYLADLEETIEEKGKVKKYLKCADPRNASVSFLSDFRCDSDKPYIVYGRVHKIVHSACERDLYVFRYHTYRLYRIGYTV